MSAHFFRANLAAIGRPSVSLEEIRSLGAAVWVYWSAYVLAVSWIVGTTLLWNVGFLPPTTRGLLIALSVLYVICATETVYIWTVVKRRPLSDRDDGDRGMLNATAIIALAAVLSFGVGVFTLFVLYGQQIAMQGQLAEMQAGSGDTRKLVQSNADLADAAKTQATTASSSLIATQRAWVGPSDASVKPLTKGVGAAISIS